MNRIHKITDQCGDKVAAEGSSSSQGPNEIFYHEIAQLTKLRSRPHELLSKDMPGRSRLPVSTMKMLLSCFKSIFACKWSCTVEQLDSRTYVSQFSDDGTLFIAGCQGSHIRIYNVDKGWKVKKDILAKSLRWTITDACLSPNQHYLVYASLSPVVHIVNIESAATESLANVTEIHDVLNFSGNDDDYDDFGIFSVKFSTDGRELVAASSDNSIYIYDLEANSCSLRVLAHKSDVNTVCFADEAGHLLYSGSDDNLCKVWDRRCFISKGKAARVLMGHLEGITFIDSRGDGLYFISNGKDQTTKLWDIRKMSSNAKDYTPKCRYSDWDYRWMECPPHAKTLKHPRDQSLITYRGHSILRTLIRCYFSPEYSTGQKYIYTGSSDCSVYIYDLVSGALVATLDHHEGLVRDCNWHPFYPMIVSSSWDCVLARWEFPGCG
ncbi:PREDICTED: LEC14B homolog [Populus euphratica]|uniref:LEC14B homolog n=1 Tax=Populus euphratica TaxID=75702 RepID=A0AAJ6XAJ9_POPEU|nr:PREDICTED: LEC14B homolog [Populus euphratica]